MERQQARKARSSQGGIWGLKFGFMLFFHVFLTEKARFFLTESVWFDEKMEYFFIKSDRIGTDGYRDKEE
jgi:hypothetical protein